MQRTFYFLIVGSIALIWLAQRMRLAVQKLVTGHPGDHMLDLRFVGYSAEDVRGYCARLGEDKRSYYLKTQTRIELAFIMAYGIAGASAGVWVSAAIFNENWKLVSWVPFIGALFIVAAAIVDLDEGQAIRKLLKAYPRIDEAAVARASRTTRLKWLFLFLGVAMLLAGIMLVVVAKLKGA
ncbi:MAG: hypothetical protein ACKVON_13115 [Beijerinckiaceae bacterium]